MSRSIFTRSPSDVGHITGSAIAKRMPAPQIRNGMIEIMLKQSFGIPMRAEPCLYRNRFFRLSRPRKMIQYELKGLARGMHTALKDKPVKLAPPPRAVLAYPAEGMVELQPDH
ncbi:hypothetical protein [Sphingomonas sp.]|uniref:hypothetical protein n=1 Tax=Sphingomonas sp. TaxID=28214 RepID=UPI003D6CA478